jgi:hypothetical protein
MEILFVNHGTSTLSSGITAIATSLTIPAADASKFPTPGANQLFKCHLVRASTGEKEIIHVTTNAAGVFTVVRAQEGTTGLTFVAGDTVALRATRKIFEICYSSAMQNFTPVVAANDLVLNAGFSTVSGNTQINRLSNANFFGGQMVRLVTSGTPTIKHNQAGGGANRAILTKTGADVVMAADKTFQAVYDESANVFREV